MPYTIKARFYSGSDNTGETYVITSDNADKDTKHEVGRRLMIIPMEAVDDAKIETTTEVKEEVFKVFDKVPSERYDEKKRVVTVNDIKIDLNSRPPQIASGQVGRYEKLMPSNCALCHISRSCPPFITYMCGDCLRELNTYFEQQEKEDNL